MRERPVYPETGDTYCNCALEVNCCQFGTTTKESFSIVSHCSKIGREYLTIHCARRIGSIQVIEQLANAMIVHGIPQYIRSDNGPEFIAKELRNWLAGIGVKTAYIAPGSPWENGSSITTR
ncbi:MAG: transposase family protein [Candidatus Nitrotoga sp.]|jgi:transposase InsO family protein|nr:transposase family protein [Candidatus Nitrotoga sp.]